MAWRWSKFAKATGRRWRRRMRLHLEADPPEPPGDIDIMWVYYRRQILFNEFPGLCPQFLTTVDEYFQGEIPQFVIDLMHVASDTCEAALEGLDD